MMTQKRSLDMIFRPQSVAVVGASNKPGNIGREIVHNLIEFEFQGPVFPVNPRLRTLPRDRWKRAVRGRTITCNSAGTQLLARR